MGVICEGTFDYFTLKDRATTEAAYALRWLLIGRPEPIQMLANNGQVVLGNASLELCPDSLQDRETWKSRFGRSRIVGFGCDMSTLLCARSRLRLSIEWEGKLREVCTLTRFV